MWDDEDYDDDWVIPRGRIHPSDVVFPVLGFAARLLDAASYFVADIQHLVGGRINYLRGQDEFYESASAEIETITQERP